MKDADNGRIGIGGANAKQVYTTRNQAGVGDIGRDDAGGRRTDQDLGRLGSGRSNCGLGVRHVVCRKRGGECGRNATEANEQTTDMDHHEVLLICVVTRDGSTRAPAYAGVRLRPKIRMVMAMASSASVSGSSMLWTGENVRSSKTNEPPDG